MEAEMKDAAATLAAFTEQPGEVASKVVGFRK
jgi:hypothetical protein